MSALSWTARDRARVIYQLLFVVPSLRAVARHVAEDEYRGEEHDR